MKILLINGSPKGERSNTHRLATAFLEGIGQAEQTQICQCLVSRKNIKPCLGCFACWNKTPGQCCQRDDMEQILSDMLWADTIVWSFPLYYFSVPGPLKNLMDRQLPMLLPFMEASADSGGHASRHDMSRKRHVVISTCGFYTAKGNYEGVYAMFDHLCGKGGYTAICCGQGELFRVKELSARTDEYLGYVRDGGREFAEGGISGETFGKLEQLLYPREVFEAMADASWGVDKSGEKTEEDLTFTRQMAALYNKKAYPGKDLILQMSYTDLGRSYQIVLGREGSRVLTEDFAEPTTIIETSYEVWKAIAAGEISGEEALMQGKYRVKGDFNLMIHWDRYFGPDTEPEQEKKSAEEKTSMLNLMSWTALWTLGGMHPVYGMVAAIAVTALLPLVLFKTKKTIYDVVSACLVTFCACAGLAGVGFDHMMIASFFCFGLMWTVSCFRPVPLSAHYSVNTYGSSMAQNPLFLRTNRIICAGWGVLYLLVPAVQLLVMGTTYESIGGLFQGIGSAAMGIFTLWFQRWYPAKFARG